MAPDSLMKLANTLHRALIKVTSGRRGWNIYGMPVIKLTTIGRVSGLKRTVMLTSPIKFEDQYCLVASKGGNDYHPDWYLNIVSNSKVEVETPLGKRTMVARVVDENDHKRLWEEIIIDFPNYDSYQKKTKRTIPIIVLQDFPID